MERIINGISWVAASIYAFYFIARYGVEGAKEELRKREREVLRQIGKGFKKL